MWLALPESSCSESEEEQGTTVRRPPVQEFPSRGPQALHGAGASLRSRAALSVLDLSGRTGQAPPLP